ncbi:MAG: helix-turn-helix transcriptional regulator [Nocardioidaceae bacterium]
MVRNRPDPRLVIGLPRMLRSSEVAELLSVTPSTLSRWRSLGVGPRVYWLSKSCPRYREDDVRDWLDRVAS